MSKLFQNTGFILGFCIGTVLFVGLNYLSYFSPANMFSCDDCMIRFGFPFTFHEKGRFFNVNQFIWSGLVVDILVAITFSFVSGIIFKFVWEKLTMKKLR